VGEYLRERGERKCVCVCVCVCVCMCVCVCECECVCEREREKEAKHKQHTQNLVSVSDLGVKIYFEIVFERNSTLHHYT